MKRKVAKSRTLKVQLYRNLQGFLKQGWRWRLRAENGRTVGASSEGYARRSDCISNLALVIGMTIPKVPKSLPAEFFLIRDADPDLMVRPVIDPALKS